MPLIKTMRIQKKKNVKMVHGYYTMYDTSLNKNITAPINEMTA